MLICDEIQCGYGRSGRFFAHQLSDIRADIITIAKGMGNGFPVAGCIIAPQIKAVPNQLGTTFGGNHLACAASIAVLEVMEKEKLIVNAMRMGDYLMQGLSALQSRHSQYIKEVRGRGLMIGIEFTASAAAIRNELFHQHRILTGISGEMVIRLLPPLCITEQHANMLLTALEAVLRQICHAHS
jgi:acetylornithine aminotransferase